SKKSITKTKRKRQRKTHETRHKVSVFCRDDDANAPSPNTNVTYSMCSSVALSLFLQKAMVLERSPLLWYYHGHNNTASVLLLLCRALCVSFTSLTLCLTSPLLLPFRFCMNVCTMFALLV
ncbi:hypothetical protein LINPERPRIM_LOCUS12715, partial [Linum perenne]